MIGIQYSPSRTNHCIEDGNDSTYYEVGVFSHYTAGTKYAFTMLSATDGENERLFFKASPLMNFVSTHREELGQLGLKFLGTGIKRTHSLPDNVYQMNVKYQLGVSLSVFYNTEKLLSLSEKLVSSASVYPDSIQKVVGELAGYLEARAKMYTAEYPARTSYTA